MDFKPGKDREEKIDKFLDNLAAYHSARFTPTGFYRAVGRIADQAEPLSNKMDELVKAIKQADKSSSKLAAALNRITTVAAIIAAVALGFEIYKYFA